MRWTALTLGLAIACGGGDDAPSGDDSGDDDTTPAGDDTAPPTCDYARPVRGAPGPLQAGTGRRRIPAPVGIGTAGLGPFGAPSRPSPFASIYPGTIGVHGHPSMEALVLSRGPGHEAVFVRVDAVGMFSQLRNDIVDRASELVGRDLDHAVMIGGTHTHSGPGRVVNTGQSTGGFFDIIAGKFFPAFYDQFVEEAAGTIADAFADLAPAEVGTAVTAAPSAHSDRRCEDDVNGEPYKNSTVPVLAVRQDGQVTAVLAAFAMHPVQFGLDDGYLSSDAFGAIEEAIEDGFDHPVEAIVFNAWGGDMTLREPEEAPTIDSAFLPPGFERIQKVGWALSDAVHTALDGLTYTDDAEIWLETHRLRIDREVIGYDDETFENYPYGGVYCEGENDCDDPVDRIEGLDDVCIPFNEEFPAPNQTNVTVGRVAGFRVVTFPGECGTRLAESLMAAMPGDEDVLFLGYTNDYLGYAITEEEWWKGGYEASGHLWGPRQGAYLRDRIAEKFTDFDGQRCPAPEPGKLDPFPYTVDAYVAEEAVQPGTLLTDVEAVYGPTDRIEIAVRGSDPWLGAPRAWIETEDGAPVTRPGGRPVDSDGQSFEVRFEADPPYVRAPSKRENDTGADSATAGLSDTAWDAQVLVGARIYRETRTFTWTFRVPVQQPVEGRLMIADGRYVLKVAVPVDGQDDVVVTSSPFEISRD